MLIDTDDIEALCGRPLAFARVVDAVLEDHFEHRELQRHGFARGAELRFDVETGVKWWTWPWDPDAPGDPPWWRCRADDMRALRRWFRAPTARASAELRVVVARLPAQPGAWLEQFSEWLRAQIGWAELEPRLLGPEQLLECALGEPLVLPWVELHRALDQRAHDSPALSATERALLEALDEDCASAELWAVVTDELLAAGAPLGESLALALAARQSSLGRRRLGERERERETQRVLSLERPRQLLAFADLHGPSLDAHDLCTPEERDELELEPGQERVRIWARRSGPFVTQLLVDTELEAWAGRGLPRSLMSAPELRYLSARRFGCIGPGAAELSQVMLAGFDLSGLKPSASSVCAVEADLRGCDLRRAELDGWILDGADLRGVSSDLGTCFADASFVEARVSRSLGRLLQGWSGAGPERGRPADRRGLIVDE